MQSVSTGEGAAIRHANKIPRLLQTNGTVSLLEAGALLCRRRATFPIKQMPVNSLRGSVKTLGPGWHGHFNFRTNYHSFPFNYLLNISASESDLKRIHALILRNGSYHSLPVLRKLFTLGCFLLPTMDYGQKLFDELPKSDVFLWNTLIRGYANVGPCQKALILYKNMHFLGLLPDSYTFPFVIRSCVVVSALREGKEVHCNIIKNGFDSDVFVQSALVTMYSQSGEMVNSELVFDKMLVRNTVSWTAMISGYVQNGFSEKGLAVFREMLASGTQVNIVTLISILPACANFEFSNLGKSIHAYGVKLGLDKYINLANCLISFYARCGHVEAASSLFDLIEIRNLVTWNSMITAYVQNDDAENAINIFMRMQTENVQIDYITMVGVISACSKLGALSSGKLVHEVVKNKGLDKNISIQNALINMYARCGDIGLARKVFEILPHKSVISYTAMIGAYAADGNGQKALELFSIMKNKEIRPNSLTFTAILTACRHSGLIEEGRKCFESMMRDYSIVPCLEHCTCLVDLFGRGGCLMEAYELVESMPIRTDMVVWGSMLTACRLYRNVEVAEAVAEKLFQLDSENFTFYVLMSNIYAEAGRWEDVERVRKLMKYKGLKKIPGHSLVEGNEFQSSSRLKFPERGSVAAL